jgi:hypothetical protein
MRQMTIAGEQRKRILQLIEQKRADGQSWPQLAREINQEEGLNRPYQAYFQLAARAARGLRRPGVKLQEVPEKDREACGRDPLRWMRKNDLDRVPCLLCWKLFKVTLTGSKQSHGWREHRLEHAGQYRAEVRRRGLCAHAPVISEARRLKNIAGTRAWIAQHPEKAAEGRARLDRLAAETAELPKTVRKERQRQAMHKWRLRHPEQIKAAQRKRDADRTAAARLLKAPRLTRIIGMELLAHDYIPNKKLLRKLDESGEKCPYGGTWASCADLKAVNEHIRKIRKLVGRPGRVKGKG